MKKTFISALMVLFTVSGTYALDMNEYKVFNKLNNEKTINSLSKYLNVNNEQREQLEYLFDLTDKKMKNAINNEDENAAEKVMWFNLGNAKYILSAEQYKKYLLSLNMTVNTMSEVSDFYVAEN